MAETLLNELWKSHSFIFIIWLVGSNNVALSDSYDAALYFKYKCYLLQVDCGFLCIYVKFKNGKLHAHM